MGILDKIYAATRANGGETGAPAGGVAPPSHVGLMRTIGGILAPEANSFWANAMSHGLFEAKTAQDTYNRNAAAADAELKGVKLDNAKKEAQLPRVNDVQLGDDIKRFDPATGSYNDVVTTPALQERLVQQWEDARAKGDVLKQRILELLLGKGNADNVLETKHNYKLEEIRTNNATKRFAPRSGGKGGSGGPPGVPSDPPPWAQ